MERSAVRGAAIRDSTIERQRKITSPGTEQCAEGNTDIHQDDKQSHRGAENRQRQRDGFVLNQHSYTGSFPGQCSCSLPFQVELLYQKHDHGNHQQHNRHRTGAVLIVCAGDLQVNGSCQRIVTAADNHRVCKVGNGLNERDQERVSDTRQQQRQRDSPEYAHPCCAHVP